MALEILYLWVRLAAFLIVKLLATLSICALPMDLRAFSRPEGNLETLNFDVKGEISIIDCWGSFGADLDR